MNRRIPDRYVRWCERKAPTGPTYSINEGNPLEPCHIHVRKHGALAKYWIGEKVMLADNIGFSAKELREIESIIISNTNLIKDAWNGFFS